MSSQGKSTGAAQQFIIDQMDLLLGRLEQLGRQVRDAVARIVGTTVADAVSETIRAVLRFVPRRAGPVPDSRYGSDTYDPYGNDDGYDRDYEGSDGYSPRSRTSWNWRGMVRGIMNIAMTTMDRLKSWPLTRWAVIGGATVMDLILLTPTDQIQTHSSPS